MRGLGRRFREGSQALDLLKSYSLHLLKSVNSCLSLFLSGYAI
jgi:hypothetical protein